jgi:hypothetical protein
MSVITGQDTITGAYDPVKVTGNNLHVAQYVWDVNSLSWVRQTGASGGAGTDVTVTNLPSQYPVVLPSYSKRYDQPSTSIAYLGNAVPGASESASVWQIQRFTYSGNNVTVEFADGNQNFDNSWTNRTSLSYS